MEENQKVEKLEDQVSKLKKKVKEAKELKPTRGIETMFRTTSKNHMELLTVVCLTTIVFAVLATRPNDTKGRFTHEDILNKETNLLFFGNFHKMKFDDYQWGMKEMLQDADYLYGSMIKDIYFLGAVLGKKYRLLRVSYTIFMFGFVLALLGFIIAELFFKSPYPY